MASLYLFLVGINGLSTAIKLMGGDFAENILTTTSNPFIALFIGILSTTIFQSSSTTTSLIVGMVSGGALNLTGAVYMIMGANIGTTGTIWLAGMMVSDGMPMGTTKHIAIVHTGVNILMAVGLLPFIHPIAKFVSRF